MPGDMWDYDEAGTHILIDGTGRRAAAQAGHPFGPQRLPLHVRARQRPDPAGKTLSRQDQLDQGHRPEDRQAGRLRSRSRTSRSIRAGRTRRSPNRTKKLCPSMAGGNNYWPSSYSPKTKLLYIPSLSSCNEVTLDPQPVEQGGRLEGRALPSSIERNESDIIVADPMTGEIKKQAAHPLSEQQRRADDRGRHRLHRLHRRHLRGLRRHHARAAVEDQCRHRLQRAADDLRGRRQAICRHPVRLEPASPAAGTTSRPELREQRNQTMLFVFGL